MSRSKPNVIGIFLIQEPFSFLSVISVNKSSLSRCRLRKRKWKHKREKKRTTDHYSADEEFNDESCKFVPAAREIQDFPKPYRELYTSLLHKRDYTM